MGLPQSISFLRQPLIVMIFPQKNFEFDNSYATIWIQCELLFYLNFHHIFVAFL